MCQPRASARPSMPEREQKTSIKECRGVFVASLKEVLSVEREALDVVRLGDDVGGADVRLEQRLLPKVVSASETPDRLFAAV